MTRETGRRQLEIYEVHTDDGGVALQFGDGPLQVGVGESDLMRLLVQVFDLPESPSYIDAELYDLAQLYLDEQDANERMFALSTGHSLDQMREAYEIAHGRSQA